VVRVPPVMVEGKEVEYRTYAAEPSVRCRVPRGAENSRPTAFSAPWTLESYGKEAGSGMNQRAVRRRVRQREEVHAGA